MAPSRREFLTRVGAVTLVATLPGCGDSDEVAPERPTPSPDFDFPLVTPLPFAHGVASGDPLADRVILWTRVTQESPGGDAVPVEWEVATDPEMTDVVASGIQNAVAEHDWTIKVDVVGLLAATTYYYRFRSPEGFLSITGRTRTAPAGDVSDIRIGVVACSSYWSSHWSGYGHLADRNDLDLIVHCGDYVYEFVDRDERVRARRGIEDIEYVDYRDWLNLNEVRRRYALYRSDPNLLRAHQQHPWSIVWDNHDISVNFGNELDDGAVDASGQTTVLADTVRAFYEWTPTRPPRGDGSGEFVLVEDGSWPEPPDPLLHWRKLPYGPMLDVFCVDTQLYLPRRERPGVEADDTHLAEGRSLFSRSQYEWLTDGMLDSQRRGVRWRLVVNQTWMTANITRWGDYQEEREAFFRFLRGENESGLRVYNSILASGDMHGNYVSDLVEQNRLSDLSYAGGAPEANPQNGAIPGNPTAGYYRGSAPEAGARSASVGVEFAPSSMGRGGFDETFGAQQPETTFEERVVASRAVEFGSMVGTPQVQFFEWVEHGYGIIHLEAEHATYELWWQDKEVPGSPDVLGAQLVSFAADDPNASPPRLRDQAEPAARHFGAATPRQGARVSEPAPEGELDPS